MGEPAAVMGDRIEGSCTIHQVPSPSGGPVPAGRLPFSAPVSQQLAATVLIEGKPAVVLGSTGSNTPPHAGLHASDPYLAPVAQIGRVVAGSRSVLFDGRPAAPNGSAATMCTEQGKVMGSATTVMVGS